MLRRVAPLLAAAAASAWTNLGPCGANGRWGETVEEKIFFLKTIKTAGSTTRFIFLRFARGERMALLRSSNPGHILLDSTGRSQRWALATYLPGARWVTVSRDVPSRVVSAIAMFHGDMSPRDYFSGCAALDRGLCRGVAVKRPGLSENVHIWNSVAWQLGERAAAPPIDFARPHASVKRLERADASALVDLVEGNHSGAFALVMLTERYDESLVLLRSIFCWRWMDLLTQQPPVAPVQQDRRNRQEKHDRPKSVKAPEVYKAKKTHPFHFAKVFEGKKKDDRNATKQRKRARAAPPLVEGGIPGAVAANVKQQRSRLRRPAKGKPAAKAAPKPRRPRCAAAPPTRPKVETRLRGPADALGATITVAVAGGLIYGAGLVIATGARALWAPAARRDARAARAPRRRLGRDALDETVLRLNALDVAVHDAARRRFDALTDAYGGPEALRAARFYRAFRFAVAVACLRCESKAPGLLPAYAALDCADFAATCVELRRVDFVDLGAVAWGSDGPRAAEAAIVELLRGCADLRAATVCPAGQPSLCATGPVCEPGTPDLPAKCDLGEADRHWHTDCAGGARSCMMDAFFRGRRSALRSTLGSRERRAATAEGRRGGGREATTQASSPASGGVTVASCVASNAARHARSARDAAHWSARRRRSQCHFLNARSSGDGAGRETYQA
ncbi:galactose-3-O-sulfotransferase 3 [Aureococcus anophagefferens]|nr:galactose-3-O-sulfotransferase 3 [Aureococcus anophagefferens]